MALIECYECGASISSYAKTCPQCGARRKRGLLESFFLISLGLVLLSFALMYWSLPSKEERQRLREMTSETDALAPTIAQAQTAISEPPGQKFLVTLAPHVSMDANKKFVVTASTNLPDGITLIVTIHHVDGNLDAGTRYGVSRRISVKNSQFSTGPMHSAGAGEIGNLPDDNTFDNPNDHLVAGTYELEIFEGAHDLDPPITWAVVGRNGENLDGPLAREFPGLGKIVEYRMRFQVDDSLQIQYAP